MPLLEAAGGEAAKGAINILIQWFRDKRKKKLKTSTLFSDSIHIKEIIDEVIYSGMDVDCFLIFLAHNGGKKMHPLSAMYYSLFTGEVNEVQMKNFERSNYVNIPMDYDYKLLLDKLVKVEGTSSIGIEVSAAPVDLKIRLQYENLKYVRFYPLHFTADNEFYHIMVGTTQPEVNLDDVYHRQRIIFEINKIQNIIKNWKL